MSELLNKLNALRLLTITGGVPVRRKNGVLYHALAECLALCEYVQANRLEEDLKAAVVEPPKGPRGKGNRKVKWTSDIYIQVCRFAFGAPQDRSSVTKYSQTIREAAARQMHSSELAAWLAKHGGARALYLRERDYGSGTGAKKTLHLNQPCDYPTVGVFTIKLQYDGKGFFNLIEEPRAVQR